MLREVETSKLTVGMYVSDLDRPWLDTPFPVQGFYIRSAHDIDSLCEYCATVFVDPRRYDQRLAESVRRLPNGAAGAEGGRKRPRGSRGKMARVDLPEPAVVYDDDSPVEDELPAARDALSSGAQRLERFWTEISARRRVRLEDVRAAVHPLVESVLRNKDALVALMRVRRADRHTHEHCLAMAVWASLMGRQLGLPPDDVRRLALGCSLVDIGMVRLPQSLLRKNGGLSASEQAVLRSHVEFSVEMLTGMGGDDQTLHDVVRWHHERMDGSGYPDGLVGGGIPMFARIAGIVDSYDSLISPRDAAVARSSFEAMMELQDLCPEQFQGELMEQFARAVGIFPSGSLVELSSGEVAVVFSQNTGRRLRPKVILILDSEKRRRDSFPVVDLSCGSEQSLRIARELAQGEYGIDAGEYFL